MKAVEVAASDDDIKALRTRVTQCWQDLGTIEPLWSVLTEDRYLSRLGGVNADDFYATGLAEAAGVANKVSEFGGTPAILSCLDYGCGVGRVTKGLAEFFQQVYAADISESHLSKAYQVAAGERVTFVDADSLPPVDVFYCSRVLQHNPPPLALRELRKLLKALRTGGLGIFQIPVQSNRYAFAVEDYLKTISTTSMEMHFTPQPAIYEVIQESGCSVLETLPDDSIGGSCFEVSSLFVVRKR